ncbi:hypothetical protein SAMN05444422_10214 [Halobiforma haloterrestris]|uniref:Geranylgeranyl diphosphate synthase, type I n=1 Tax=Natronobacterium haloterrestre TaxID=148448 RepID=A0A1I1E0X3_NATHA|nr:hypothetical protein [Halobiforma haloterrestris]SFB78888.1 hypothetical protein SAMN05444422_10214 [Halobiforma haloterrestris]
MRERTYTDDANATAEAAAGLASPIGRLVSAALPARERSVPAALCTVAVEVAAMADRGADPDVSPVQVTEPLIEAVVSLEGYLRIRRQLVDGDSSAGMGCPRDVGAGRNPGSGRPIGDRNRDRDAAVLASDYLHAAAYAAAGETPVPAGRGLELYRVLASGSTALSHEFLERSLETRDPNGGHAESLPPATVAGVAAELGATALGASGEIRAALETYSRSLAAALVASSGDSSDADPSDGVGSFAGPIGLDLRRTVVRVLSTTDGVRVPEEQGTSTVVPGAEPADSDGECHLERAREAVATLERAVDPEVTAASTASASASTSASTSEDGDDPRARANLESPLVRLERATRVPFGTGNANP